MIKLMRYFLLVGIVLVIFFILLCLYVYIPSEKVQKIEEEKEGKRAIYNAYFGPDYKYHIPPHILNDPNIRIIYYE